jgi:GR25 family glycosyltransferase involved in LPS biosynthesis
MELGLGAKDKLRTDILTLSNKTNPDLTFLHIQRPGVIDAETASMLKGIVINYTYDVALPIPEWFYEIGNNIDLTLFCDEPGVWDFKSKGLDSEFIHPGYDETLFTPNGTKGEYGDIVFLGNHYSQDQNFDHTQTRFDMVQYLKNVYNDSFKVYGNGWSFNDGNLMYREEKEAECYRSCKIAINFSHFDLERYTSDRMFRIMGSGAFCLSKWYPGIEKDFKDGVHLRVWKDFNELKTLIDYYLINTEERESIAKVGQEYVSSTSTWEIKTKTIVDMAKARMSKEYKSRVVKVQQQIYIKPVVEIPQVPNSNTVIQRPEQDPSVPPSNQNAVIQPIITPIQVVQPAQPVQSGNKVITCMNDYFDKIYCINLNKRPDRWSLSSTEFSKNNLIVQRFAAVDGDTITETKNLNKWERACFMSHVTLLKEMIDKGYDRILILEDDIEFINNLQDYFLRNIKFIPEDWNMLYLGGNHINPPTQINPAIARTSRTYTTGSYGISRRMAEGVLRKIERAGINSQIDVFYSDFHRGGGCYTYSPKIAWQRPGYSDIQQGMQDYTGIIR